MSGFSDMGFRICNASSQRPQRCLVCLSEEAKGRVPHVPLLGHGFPNQQHVFTEPTTLALFAFVFWRKRRALALRKIPMPSHFSCHPSPQAEDLLLI